MTHGESETKAFRWRQPLDLTLLAVAAFVVRLPALHQPLDRDLAGYGTMGWRLLHGDVPYRDLFEQKQPLVYPVYSLLHLLTPHHTEAVRVAAVVAGTLTAWLLYALVRRFAGRNHALAAAALFVVAGSSSYVEGFDLNTEHILVPITAAAVLLSLRFHTSPSRWMPPLVGLLAGVMVLAKVTGVFAVPAVLLPVVLAGATAKDRIRRFVTFGLGAALPVAAVLGAFAAVGALDDMIDTTVRFNLFYNENPGSSLVGRLLGFDSPVGALVLAGLVVGTARFVTEPESRILNGTLLTWAVGTWVGACYGVSGFPHYFAPVIAPAVVLLALPVRLPAGLALQARTTLVAQSALLVALALPFVANLQSFVGLHPSQVAVKVYGSQAWTWADYEPVGRLMAEHAPPGARAMVWGAESGFYWFSGIPPATRYFFDYPVFMQPERAEEQARYLCERPPEVVVLPGDYGWGGYFWAPEMALRAEHYRLVVEQNSTQVFLREGDGRQPWCRELLRRAP